MRIPRRTREVYIPNVRFAAVPGEADAMKRKDIGVRLDIREGIC